MRSNVGSRSQNSLQPQPGSRLIQRWRLGTGRCAEYGGLASSLLLTLVLVPIVYIALAPKREPLAARPDGTRSREGSVERVQL